MKGSRFFADAARSTASAATTRSSRQPILWGEETRRAISNFPVSGERMPMEVVHWLGRIKAAAAQVNAVLGVLKPKSLAARVVKAAHAVACGEYDDQFPVDVFQTGSGTSSNMNVNEVIAALSGPGVHPNDHVNMGQSSNDVFPSAVHLAALELVIAQLLPALKHLASALTKKSRAFRSVVKTGRTHLMDAVPVTLGQEFGGYAAQIRQASDRIVAALPRLGEIPLGGTAVGTGLNTHPEFAARVRQKLMRETKLKMRRPSDPFAAQGNRDGLVEMSAALKGLAVALMKIANDLRWMGSGPHAGLSELVLPALQKGSSIMPGKVNPVIPEVVCQVCAQVIGNDVVITVAGMSGNFELNAMVPVMARNLIQSVKLMSNASMLLADRCVKGLEPDRSHLARTLAANAQAATSLTPYIGYDKAGVIVKAAQASGRSIGDVAREYGIAEPIIRKATDLKAMAKVTTRFRI